ncbi:MAG: LysM peptidoglycan-binding domain-containing M23 family metallopeptidase [Deltaproteobacteria bacterium]|nr:LysM peptidoglycan-binding domain-containing M23 family metallopeptidase [Deltaproteobacteria bacterium]
MGNKKVTGHWSLVLFLLVFLLTSCATSYDSRGVYHRVRRGESLLWVAKAYGVDLQDLAEMNNIQNVDQELVSNEKLYIPDKREFAYKKLPVESEIASHMSARPASRKKSAPAGRKTFPSKSQKNEKIYTDHNRFEWPVLGAVLSPFGIRHGRRHDGVDIKATTGTPIRAADKGVVVYAGSMRGYGNLILIRHPNNFFTAYAHNKKNGVKVGEKIKRGQQIGLVGRTGRATGSHLHFEIREGEKARNPLFFLPVKASAMNLGEKNESDGTLEEENS